MREQEAQIFKPEPQAEEMEVMQAAETAVFADEARDELVAAATQETTEVAGDTFREDLDVKEEGFLARTGARISEFARDHMPRKLTVGLAAAAIAVGGAVETSNQNTEKAEAAATAARTLGPNALKKLCVKAGLKMPVIRQTGNRETTENAMGNLTPRQAQGWKEIQHWRLVPDECNGRYQRLSWIKPEVQNHQNHKQWQGVYRPRWNYIGASNKGFGDASDTNYIDYNEFSAQSMTVYAPKTAKTPYYRCTAGPGVTKARVKIRNRVKDVKTGKVVGQRVGKFPTLVVGAC